MHRSYCCKQLCREWCIDAVVGPQSNLTYFWVLSDVFPAECWLFSDSNCSHAPASSKNSFMKNKLIWRNKYVEILNINYHNCLWQCSRESPALSAAAPCLAPRTGEDWRRHEWSRCEGTPDKVNVNLYSPLIQQMHLPSNQFCWSED